MVELIFFPSPCLLFLELHLKTRTARVLLDYLIKEIDIVKMCTDCYRNANIREMGWFTHVCRKPHLIVWTKRCDYNYWPAKVMSTNGDGDVMLQFFGNHTKANVCAASSCFLYSRENPGHSNVSSYLYKSALKVSKERSVLTKIDFPHKSSIFFLFSAHRKPINTLQMFAKNSVLIIWLQMERYLIQQ